MNFEVLFKDKFKLLIVITGIVFCVLLIPVFYFYCEVENLLEANQLQLAIQRSETTSVVLNYCLISFYILEVLIFSFYLKQIHLPVEGVDLFNPFHFYGILISLFFFGCSVTSILPSQTDLIMMHSKRINGSMIFCKVLAASHFKQFTKSNYEIQEDSNCNDSIIYNRMFIVVNSPNKNLMASESYPNRKWILDHPEFRLKIPALKSLNPQLVYTLDLEVQCGHTPIPGQYVRLGYDSVLHRIFNLEYENSEESIVKVYNEPFK